jgi:photosystem II stability/assembly factor-like uncharacterized protein
VYVRAQQGNWVRVDSLPLTHYNAIACSDSGHCMAIGNDVLRTSSIRRTTDGGRTWGTVFTETNNPNPFRYAIRFFDVAHPTPDLCIVAADSGATFRSSDAGKTWARLNSVDTAQFFNVEMLDEHNGIMLDADVGTFRYFRTIDGGLSWQTHQMPMPEGLATPIFYRLAYPMPFVLIGIVKDYDTPDYVTVRSTDNGTTWESHPAPSQIGRSLFFLDSETGWSIAFGGESIDFRRDVIYHTANGGRTWETQLDTVDALNPSGLEGLEFRDELNGLAVGNLGKIYRTTDGGAHWIREANELTYSNGPSFQDVAFWMGTQLVVDRYNGTIYRYEASAGVETRPEASSTDRIYPNPVRTGDPVNLSFNVNARGLVRIALTNVLGQEVTGLADGPMEVGGHTLRWLPGDLPAGAYFLRLIIGGHSRTLPFTVVR